MLFYEDLTLEELKSKRIELEDELEEIENDLLKVGGSLDKAVTDFKEFEIPYDRDWFRRAKGFQNTSLVKRTHLYREIKELKRSIRKIERINEPFIVHAKKILDKETFLKIWKNAYHEAKFE